ncbi:upstream stimulatory factor-like isoform X4 [Limulus polyphemus]|uniref:Upstream stimulatory factor-like isoform X4 n=1 Tax=Limulus polyphemus TaxID=6850 RepID=A0ABM1TM57_LIMPO|nr:upstream stimulatory factor-like isoform X4 [Limulus polyphemus]
MDMLDQPLDTSSGDQVNDSGTSDDTSHIPADDNTVNTVEDAIELHATQPTSNLLDPTVHYQFRAENGHGTVTYRVVQVAPECDVNTDASAHVVTTAAALVGQQVAQTILTSYSTTNDGDSPTSDVQPSDTRFAYFPAVADGSITSSQSEATALPAPSPGQFYVMMSPQDVLQPGQRTLAPRTHQFSPKLDITRTARDERRRATHNEVERKRRDKINNWIMKLSKVVPDCSSDHTKQGQSKGGVLAKACDYIQELRNANARLPEILKENERLTMDVELLRRQCEDIKNENQMFQVHLQQQGITVTDRMGTNGT